MRIYQRAIVEQVLKGGTFRLPPIRITKNHEIDVYPLRKHAQKPNCPLCRRRSDSRTQSVRSSPWASDMETIRTSINTDN